MRKILVTALISLSLLTNPSASAHQPVVLQDTDTTAAKGPLLVDATISFAIRASFTKAGQTRALRAQFKEGDQLDLQYLIIDKRPESALKATQLPSVVITSPSGSKVSIKFNERTKFFEPYSRTNYLYLARYSAPAQAGIYSITITSRTKSAITLAIGEKEIQGEVVRSDTAAAACPSPDSKDAETGITQARAGRLVGMSEAQSQKCAQSLNWGYRIAARDGEMFMLTKDYRFDRVSVYIKADKIFAVDVG